MPANRRLETEGLTRYFSTSRLQAWIAVPGGSEGVEVAVGWARQLEDDQRAVQLREERLAACLRANNLAHFKNHALCKAFVAAPQQGQDPAYLVHLLLEQLDARQVRTAELLARWGWQGARTLPVAGRHAGLADSSLPARLIGCRLEEELIEPSALFGSKEVRRQAFCTRCRGGAVSPPLQPPLPRRPRRT